MKSINEKTTDKPRKRRKPLPGGRYTTRWKKRKERELNMSPEEKSYREQLIELLGKLDKVRAEAVFLTAPQVAKRIEEVSAEYRVDMRPAPPIPPTTITDDDTALD